MNSVLAQRVRQRLDALNRSASSVSKKATGNVDAIRRIFAGHVPNGERLDLIAAELGTTAAWLLGRDAESSTKPLSPAQGYMPPPDGDAHELEDDRLAYIPRRMPKDVPVLGTAMGSTMDFRQDGRSEIVEMMEIDEGDVIDWVRRPAGLAGRKDVYAIYHTGISMTPRFFPGGLSFVDGRRAPNIGDAVVAQIARPDADGDPRVYSVLVKTLVKRTAEYIEFEQYEPRLRFTVPTAQVKRMHRIMENNDLYGI
jgi:phage repressor protein C with HTH and peptisase S24 domain